MDYWLVFFAGLVGSMHCVGMCGAIVLGYSTQGMNPGAKFSALLSSHLTYNGGRVLSYTFIGAALGSLGGGISGLQGVGYWFSLVMGVLIVLFGISLLKIIPAFSFSTEINIGQPSKNIFFKLYRATFGALITQRGLESKFYIGLITPLLPCGLLYGMFLKAASTSSIIEGALTMLLFGLGIVPALVVAGFASSYFSYTLRKWADKIAAVTMILMGLSILWRALNVSAMIGMQQHVH